MVNNTHLLVVGVLTYNRIQLLQKTLAHFCNQFSNSINMFKILIYDNGSNYSTLKANEKIAIEYNADFYKSDNYVKPANNNELIDQNISKGHNVLANLMKQYTSQAYLILEDDWECISTIDVEGLIKILNAHKEIGQIRLRNCRYDSFVTGYSSINFITRQQIQWTKSVSWCDYKIKFGNLHWTNNPALISKDALELISKGFEDEIECMKEFYNIFPINGQLEPGIFIHIGPWRDRTDLIKKGYIKIL